MKYFLLTSVLVGFLAGCNYSTSEEPVVTTAEQAVTSNPVDKTAIPVTPTAAKSAISALPSFRIVNANNLVLDISQFKGKKLFVNLWATWCPPCRAEIPSIESLGAKTDKNKVEFIMLSLDDNFEKAKSFATKNDMKLPVYYPAGNLPQLFNVEGIPVTFIFNERGEIIYQHTGSTNYNTNEFIDLLSN